MRGWLVYGSNKDRNLGVKRYGGAISVWGYKMGAEKQSEERFIRFSISQVEKNSLYLDASEKHSLRHTRVFQVITKLIYQTILIFLG